MITFSLPAKKVVHLPQLHVTRDVTLSVLIEQTSAIDVPYTHLVYFYEGGELVETASIYLHTPVIITRDSFLSMWRHLLTDRVGENSDPRINTRKLMNGGRVLTPSNLGYPSIVLITEDRRSEWCLTVDEIVWPKRFSNHHLPMVRKNGVRIVQTSWNARDIWTNFGITQEQLCIELWNNQSQCLARYFCPFQDCLSRDSVQKAHLDIPLGDDVFDLLIDDWDDREKFRLRVQQIGPLVFMSSVDGEVKAIASATTFTPRALHVVRILHEELLKINISWATIFKKTVAELMFNENLLEHEVEQNLLLLSFNAVEEMNQQRG